MSGSQGERADQHVKCKIQAVDPLTWHYVCAHVSVHPIWGWEDRAVCRSLLKRQQTCSIMYAVRLHFIKHEGRDKALYVHIFGKMFCSCLRFGAVRISYDSSF